MALSLLSYYGLFCLGVLGTQLKYVGVTYIYLMCCKYVWLITTLHFRNVNGHL